MTLNPTDLKKGVVFSFNGQIYQVLQYQQKVMARQQANISVKARHLQTNKLWQHTFGGSEQIEEIELTKQTVQFLYKDETGFHFMDLVSYQQHCLAAEVVADKALYMLEGQKFILCFNQDKPLVLELPQSVWLPVKSAPVAVKGDTSGALSKEVEVTTGLKVKVPAFIKEGDIISVETTSGSYRERQK